MFKGLGQLGDMAGMMKKAQENANQDGGDAGRVEQRHCCW